MNIKDKNILESLTKKYGKSIILNEISNELIRKTIDKYERGEGRRHQLSKMKDMTRNVIEVEDGFNTWIVDIEYDGVYVFDESTYLRFVQLSKVNKETTKHAIWTFKYNIGEWRNTQGDNLFPLTSNIEFAKILAKAVANKSKNFRDKELDESLAITRNVDYTDYRTYYASRDKELDFLAKDGNIGYVKYYAYVNDYMILWYPGNKMTISEGEYAFDILNGVWLNEHPWFEDKDKAKARYLTNYISEVSPRVNKKFKDWHNYME